MILSENCLELDFHQIKRRCFPHSVTSYIDDTRWHFPCIPNQACF